MSRSKKNLYKDSDVILRRAFDGDALFLSELLSDPDVLRWFPMTDWKEVQDAIRMWRVYIRRNCVFAVELQGKPVGMSVIYVNTFEKLSKQSIFAMVIAKEHRGKGLGSCFLEYIMQQAYNNFGIKLLHLEVYEGNPAYKLYSRMGFKEYGRHERFLKKKDGTYDAKILMEVDLAQWINSH